MSERRGERKRKGKEQRLEQQVVREKMRRVGKDEMEKDSGANKNLLPT